MNLIGIVAAAGMWSGIVAAGVPSEWSLQGDWSERANPYGAWSYREGTTPLPHVDWWQKILGGWTRPQPGWADSEDGNNRLPFWFKSNGTETFVNDIPTSAITVHSTDPSNGVGNGDANAVWTSPFRGRIDISGSVWMARDIGRSNDWSLWVDGVKITGGSIFSGDPYSSANPFFFELGSGGASVLQDVAVCEGTEVMLKIVRTSPAGDFVVTHLDITQTAVFPPCDADLNTDCAVDGADLGLLLSAWGTDGANVGADLNGDGTVNGADLGLLLSSWGGCPES